MNEQRYDFTMPTTTQLLAACSNKLSTDVTKYVMGLMNEFLTTTEAFQIRKVLLDRLVDEIGISGASIIDNFILVPTFQTYCDGGFNLSGQAYVEQ